MNTHIECVVHLSALITVCFDAEEKIPEVSGVEFGRILAENFMGLPHLNTIDDTAALIDAVEVVGVTHEEA